MSKQADSFKLMAYGYIMMRIDWVDGNTVEAGFNSGVPTACIKEVLETMLACLSEYEVEREAKRSH